MQNQQNERKEHNCEFKKSNMMVDVLMDYHGNCYCKRCFAYLDKLSVHPNVFKNKR